MPHGYCAIPWNDKTLKLNLRFSELRRGLEDLLKKLGVGAEEERLCRGAVDVEDLDQEAEDDGHQRQYVHLAFLPSSLFLFTSVTCATTLPVSPALD